MILPFVGGSYKELSLNLDAQNCINFYTHPDPTGKFQSALYSRPALTMFCPGTDKKSVRGIIVKNDLCVAVIDNGLYTVDINGNRKLRGTLLTSVGRVSMIVNGYQCEVTDGFFGYIYQYRDVVDGNPTDIFYQITDEHFKAPLVLTYQDGYALYPIRNSQLIQRSVLGDISDYEALGFAGSTSDPDWVVSAVSSHQELWVFNLVTTQVFYNAGAVDNPFQPRQTLLIEYGCQAPYSVAKADNGSIFWLSSNQHGKGLVVRVQGYVPEIISTPPITRAINNYSTIDDAFGFVFETNSHIFYVLTFPTANATWVYDLLTKEWFEWTSTLDTAIPDEVNPMQGRWRPNCYAKFFDKHLVGDFETGNIYYLDFEKWDNYMDNGAVIVRERTSRHYQKELKRITFNEVQIAFEEGVGGVEGQSYNPQVMLQYSKDNGHSWSSEKWQSIGKTGEYKYRARWKKLGRARDWVFRIRLTDPVKTVVLGLNAELEVEP